MTPQIVMHISPEELTQIVRDAVQAAMQDAQAAQTTTEPQPSQAPEWVDINTALENCTYRKSILQKYTDVYFEDKEAVVRTKNKGTKAMRYFLPDVLTLAERIHSCKLEQQAV